MTGSITPPAPTLQATGSGLPASKPGIRHCDEMRLNGVCRLAHTAKRRAGPDRIGHGVISWPCTVSSAGVGKRSSSLLRSPSPTNPRRRRRIVFSSSLKPTFMAPSLRLLRRVWSSRLVSLASPTAARSGAHAIAGSNRRKRTMLSAAAVKVKLQVTAVQPRWHSLRSPPMEFIQPTLCSTSVRFR
jgi:hypothetical protein